MKLGTNIPRTYHIVLLLLLHVRVGGVELVELQQGQVRFQIITCVWRNQPQKLKCYDLYGYYMIIGNMEKLMGMERLKADYGRLLPFSFD